MSFQCPLVVSLPTCALSLKPPWSSLDGKFRFDGDGEVWECIATFATGHVGAEVGPLRIYEVVALF